MQPTTSIEQASHCDEGIGAIFQSAVGGDERSWQALVAELGDLIRAIARAHRLSEADAADVAQIAWLRLLEHREKLRDPARVASWLATTARRECLRVLRESKRHVALDEHPAEIASVDAPPGHALLTLERDRAVRSGFERLREGDRKLLRLLLAEPRLGYEEISAALDMPIGSIGPTRARALERLRRELNSQGTLALLST